MADQEDLRFLYEQARRYVTARPWERLAGASVYLDLKAGSWYKACVEHISNGRSSVVLVFPGHRNMLDYQRAGLAEPPAGTIFVELIDDPSSTQTRAEIAEYGWPADLRPIPGFQTITPYGWLPLERGQIRLLALAFAAITDFDAATDGAANPEIAGELTLPGATRGRYRARRAPADDGNLIPLMSMPRHDLYGDGDGTLTFTSTSWPEYRALRAGASVVRPATLAFEERGDIPLVEISAAPAMALEIARKLTAADPLGVAFGEMPQAGLAAIAMGLKESYVLVEAQGEQEELMLWRHMVRAADGAHVIVIKDQVVEPKTQTIHAIFECRSGAS
jgi:hypothetical protein